MYTSYHNEDIRYLVNTDTKTAICVGRDSQGLKINNLTIRSTVRYNTDGDEATVVGIGDNAFSFYTDITGYLTLPETLTSIGKNAFRGCTGLKDELTIPSSVKTIGDYAFCDCSGFYGSLNIPYSVTSIGDYAFYGCSGFNKSLDISARISSIGSYTFGECSGLTGTLTIPYTVTSIGKGAFTNCIGFSSLSLRENLKTIGEQAFSNINFETIKSAPITPPTLEGNTYVFSNYDATIYIPYESFDAYASAQGWDNFTNRKASDGPTYIWLDNRNLTIYVGEQSTLTPTILPESTPYTNLDWCSKDESIASVNDGIIEGIKPGKTTIIATTIVNDLSASCEVTVLPVEATNLTLNINNLILNVGETKQLVPTITPDNTTDKTIYWVSSDESVVIVDDTGNVTAMAGGNATITATIGENISAECEVLVPEALDGGVAFRYDAEMDGAVVYSIPDEECYVVPQTVSLPDGRSYAVKGVELTEQPASLRKVAYPQGVGTNFSTSVVAVPYDADCTVADGLITDPAAGRLVFVDIAASGSFEIPATMGSVSQNAFALCSGITALVIADSNDVLAFEGTTNDGPAFASSPLTSLYMGRNITAAGESPFRGNATLTELTLGPDVTTVTDKMFYECTALRELSLPASLTKAGYASFGFCTGLSQVIIEDSRSSIDLTSAFLGSTMDYLYMGRPVTGYAQWPRTLKAIETGRYVDTLGPNAFIDLPNLYSLTIGVGMRTLDVDAFKDSKITKVIWLPNTPPTGYEKIVADINYVSTTNYELANMTVSANLSAKFMVNGLVYVFNKRAADRTCAVIDSHYNRYLTALDVPHKVTYQGIELTVEEINDYALYANRYFRTASIGDGIVSVGRYALFCCDGISSAPYIGKAVQTIGDHAFFGCSGIPSVMIPDATEFLGPWSLASCTALQSAILGTGLKVIEQGCFSDDSSLQQIVVPANVQTIANQVFDRCTSLAYLEISDRTTTLTMGYSEHNDSYKPSDGTIGGLATAGVPLFYYCPLKEAYIGGDISYSSSPADGYSPFYRNDYLEKVIIYNNETEISDNEFYGCRNLYEVIVGNDVTRVGDYAFSGCLNLEYFTLGSKVETIGVDAFSDCDKMKELRSYNPVPPVCGDQAMDDINVFTCTLFVPHSSVEAYQNAPQWENFFHIEGIDTETILVEAIVLDPEEWTGRVGASFSITATVTPIDAENKTLSWSSSDTTVATVDDEGLVTINGVGNCLITARANDGSGVSASCNVTVRKKTSIFEIELDGDSSVTVYNLQGIKLDVSTAEQLKQLEPGLYIINGEKVFLK
ncbi:MAG: leucine-rich repeat protein [Muribaculaceae bacterium]|nr:leucine-rich repeat protein [Muribaculaceae bacterium]